MNIDEKLRPIVYLFNRFILKKSFMRAKARHNITLIFKTEDAVGRYIYKHGTYEPPITSLVESIGFKKDDIIIDVGAHIGWYSILIDRISPEGVHIFSFEPDPLNFKLLNENIKINSADKIVPINKAVGESNRKAKLYLYPDKNRGRHSLLPMYKYSTVEVNVIRLDSFTKERNIKYVKLLKIDVEGYEFFVLKGALNTLNFTENVILEYSPEYMIKGGIQPRELKKLLKDFSFKLYLIEDKLKEIHVDDLPEKGEPINLYLRA